jgi:hypothetical protein
LFTTDLIGVLYGLFFLFSGIGFSLSRWSCSLLIR